MTTISEFNHNPCPKWGATDVNAYFDLFLDESNLTRLVLDNSWGGTSVDLSPAIKAGETVTHLMLNPVDAPVYLRYDNEAGDPECIHGDDLSRIISLLKLKDVADEEFVEGDALVMGADGLFHRYSISDLEARVAALENNQ